jgi:molybdenum cofactor biosynthesis enzyme MoaA
LNCFYCHNEGQPKSAQYLSDELFGSVLQLVALAREPLRAVTLSGGEPLLHPRLEWFVQELARYCPKITIITNGILLTEARALSLRDAGVSKIRLGIDSFHKNSRPSSLFPPSWKVSDTLSMIESLGIHTELNVVLTRYNANEMRDLLSLLYEKKVSAKFFEHVKVGGNGNNNIQYPIFTTNPRISFHYFDSLVKDVTKGAGAVNCPILGAANQIYQFDGFEFRYCRYLCDFDLCYTTGTRIDPDGFIYTCMNNRNNFQITSTEDAHSSLQSIRRAVEAGCSNVPTILQEEPVDPRNRIYHQA